MATSVVFPRVQFFANNGRLLIGGRIHTYVAGSSTRARTYKDAAKAQPNANPIILDARGEAAIYLAEGVEYKFVIEDSTGALILTQEPVYGAIWPNAESWPSDATLSYQYMTEAKAAAGAIGPVKFYDTKAQADAAIGTMANGDIIEVAIDETRAGARTRYKVQAGALVFVVNLDQVRLDLAAPSGAGMVGYLPDGVGAVATNVQSKLREFASVKDFGAVGDGVADDTTAVQAAVTHCFTSGDQLYWPDGTYLTTASISNFHSVRHVGPGVVVRGAITWPITPDRNSLRRLYVSPSGNNADDGLSAGGPMAALQTAIDRIHQWGPVIGRQQIIGAGGVYNEVLSIPVGLAMENNYLEFKFPSDPGVRGDPAAWPAGGAILDGTGKPTTSHGITVNQYNNVSFEYLLVRNWYNTGVGATSQVIHGVLCREFSNTFFRGCSGIGNGLTNIGLLPFTNNTITGGIFSGARQGLNNTGGNMSLTATAETYTTIKSALEYGLYAKHQSSSVLDFTEFLDNGQHALASAYGAALFAYKPNTSIDTRTCTFKRNNIVYNNRGGYISTHPASPDVMGVGADANDRIWLNKGFGADDLINYRSLAGRELSLSFGGGTVTGATALAFDSGASIPAAYLTSADQYLELEIFAHNNAGGTAQIRPSMVTPGGTRYELGNFLIAASTNAKVRLIVQTSSSGAVASVYYDNIGATLGGTSTGQVIVNPIAFDASALEFQVWGDTTAANVLAIRKARCILWG